MNSPEISGLIGFLFNYELVYQLIGQFNAFILIGLAFIPLFGYIRMIAAASDVTVSKGIGAAYRDFYMGGKIFILYIFFGGFAFWFLYEMRQGFAFFGGVEGIHANFVELKTQMLHEKRSGVLDHLVYGLSDIFSGLNILPGSYLIYKATSSFYKVVLHMFEFILAVYIVMNYAAGFYAMASKVGGRLVDVSEAWVKTFNMIVLYILFETIGMYLLKKTSDAGLTEIKAAYGGTISLSLTAYYLYASVYMIMILIFKVMAASMANSYANGYSAGDAMVRSMNTSMIFATLPVVMMSTFMGSKAVKGLKSILPDTQEGNRKRDMLARGFVDKKNNMGRSITNRIMGK